MPAYNQCAAPDRTHGPPLAFPSCSPPAATSSHLTIGTPDANGAAANLAGFARYDVNPGDPEHNIVFTTSISEVRCRPGVAGQVCNGANATGGPDYSGELEVNTTIRVTDHFNAVAAGGGTDPAALVDLPAPVPMSCVNTADTSIGGTCTFIQGPCPTFGCSGINNGKRAVIGITRIAVFDGGQDGVASTTPNTLFAVQGLFVP